MQNLIVSSSSCNLQKSDPPQNIASASEWIDQEAALCTLYAADCVKKIIGYQCGLGELALWGGRAPELWGGRRFDDLLFSDASGKEYRRGDLAASSEVTSRQATQTIMKARGASFAEKAPFVGSLGLQAGKDPLLPAFGQKAKAAAAAILKAYEQAASAAAQGSQSLEAFKASEAYKEPKKSLRLVDYRLSLKAAGLTRAEVTALANRFEPRNDNEPYCVEYLELWNGCIELDVDGIFGILNGRPAAEQLARALPTIGIAGLIGVAQSPSGCGLVPLFFIGRQKAPRNRGELKRLYASIYADLATYCGALGCKLPPIDAAFNGASHLINTPRYCSPFPFYGVANQWSLERPNPPAPEPSEVAGAGVKRRKAPAKQSEELAARLLALHETPFSHRPRNAEEAAQMQTARVAVWKNEEASRVTPWRPNSANLPPKLAASIEHNAAQQISGGWAPALKKLAAITAPRFSEIQEERRKEDARKAEENARKLADLKRRLASSSEAASRYENRKQRAFETAKFENLRELSNAKQGARDKTAADCFYKIGRAAKRYGLPEGAPADVLEFGAQIIESIGLFQDADNPKWRKDCAVEIRRLFNKGYSEASEEPLNERPFPPSPPRLRVIPGGASSASDKVATPEPSEALAVTSPAKQAETKAPASEESKAAPASDKVATPSEALAVTKAATIQEAGNLIFEELRGASFLENDDWFYRGAGKITFEKVTTKAFKAVIRRTINRINLYTPNKKGEFEPFEQTQNKLTDLEFQVYCAATEASRKTNEFRQDSIIYRGAPNIDLYLTADGKAVEFDREERRAVVTSDAVKLSDCVSTSVHLATAPATDAEGRLLTYKALEAGDKVKALFDHFSEGDPRRLHRILNICGRMIARRLGFDASSDHSLIVVYGEKGAGKTLLSNIIEAVRGEQAASSRRAKQTALDASNRFGAAELFTAQNVYIDDLTFKKVNISVLLNLAAEWHEVEMKGKDSKKVHCFPNFMLISNNEPPLEGNPQALARRFSPLSVNKPLPPADAAEWIAAARNDKDFQRKFLAVSISEYFRQLKEGYVQTADDEALLTQVDQLAPFEADLRKFFRPSDQFLSEHKLRSIIKIIEGREIELWEFKRLKQNVCSIFGSGAVKYENRNARYFIGINKHYQSLIRELEERRAYGETLSMSDLAAEKDLAEFQPTPPPLDSLPATPEPPAPEPRKVAPPSASSSASAGKVATPPAKEAKAPASEPPRIITATEAPRPSDVGAYVEAFNLKLEEAAKGSGWRPDCKASKTKKTFSIDLAQYAKQIKSEVSDLERRAELEGIVSTALSFALSKD